MTENFNTSTDDKKNEKLLENRRKFKPKNDVIFQELFKPGNEDITKAFLSSIIKENITEINMDVSTHTNRDYLNSKLGILDLRVKLENNNYKVYTQKNEYKYKDEVKKVQENEELIAIKEK